MDSSPPVSCPWNSPGKNTEVRCHLLFQRRFLTQGLNQGLCITLGFFTIRVTREASSGQFSHSIMSWLYVTPWTAAHQASLSITNSQSLPTHVHRVGDAIQPSHPLLSPSSLALNLSQHQGLFQWVSSSHHVAKALGLQLQHQSFQWIFRSDFLLYSPTLTSIHDSWKNHSLD